MKLNFFFKRKKKKRKLVHVFPLCRVNSVPHWRGEENLICLDVLLSNPPFSSPSEAFYEANPNFLIQKGCKPHPWSFFWLAAVISKAAVPQHRPWVGTETEGWEQRQVQTPLEEFIFQAML